MSPDLEIIGKVILNAKTPESVFGVEHPDEAYLTHQFKYLSKAVHPDVNPDAQDFATEVFQRLNELYQAGLSKIQSGTYGLFSANYVAEITTKNCKYGVYDATGTILLGHSYPCVIDDLRPGIIHLADAPKGNQYIDNEAKALIRLVRNKDPNAHGFVGMLPQFMETFTYENGGIFRQANSFLKPQGYVTLEQILEACPEGLHPKDMAWGYRRLLDILGYAHANNVIHGAVLPNNILIGLDDVHDVILWNWQCAVMDDSGHIPAAFHKYRDTNYPPEVHAKETPKPSTDLFMLAVCMSNMVWGLDPSKTVAQYDTLSHKRIRGFLTSCLFAKTEARPHEAWKLREEFSAMIDQLWGKREYRPLSIPKLNKENS